MPPVDPRRRGELGELLALQHLERLGFTLLARNFHTRGGEIDLIVRDTHTLIFTEVKTRSANGVHPLLAITRRKRAHMRSAAAAWLTINRPDPPVRELRFDAIA